MKIDLLLQSAMGSLGSLVRAWAPWCWCSNVFRICHTLLLFPLSVGSCLAKTLCPYPVFTPHALQTLLGVLGLSYCLLACFVAPGLPVLLCTACTSWLSLAIAFSCTCDNLCEQAMSIALSSLSSRPWLSNFSHTLGELVANTIRSLTISSLFA